MLSMPKDATHGYSAYYHQLRIRVLHQSMHQMLSRLELE